jgi:hypothetical protein
MLVREENEKGREGEVDEMVEEEDCLCDEC